MLKIIVPGKELYDESTNSFIETKETVLQLEHSLISLSKWEMKWHKPFMSDKDKTNEEILDYIKCMTVNQVSDENIYFNLTEENVKEIHDYIHDPMTATTIKRSENTRKTTKKEIITNEIIYYWMLELGIPSEYEKWHLNRLLTLIEVASIKKAPPKKRSSKDTIANYKQINELRKKQWGTTG